MIILPSSHVKSIAVSEHAALIMPTCIVSLITHVFRQCNGLVASTLSVALILLLFPPPLATSEGVVKEKVHIHGIVTRIDVLTYVTQNEPQ